MKTDEPSKADQKNLEQAKNYDERNVKTREYKLFWMSFAAILMASGTHFFKYPNSFVIGGVEGMSIITSMFVPFSRPQLTLFFNLALLLIGLFIFGKKFTIRTGYVAILNSLTALALDKIIPIEGSLTGNKMLELIFTLLMSSVGSAILFNLAASSGGTDIVAMIMKKYTSLEVGKSLLVVDSIFTIASIKIFGIEIGLFSVLGLMMKGIFVDLIIGSMNSAKLFIIITSKTEEVGKFIKKDLNRSATIVDARGLYKGSKISVFFCVTSTFESAKFRSYIKNIDPYSFITILNTSSIIGKGWYSADDQLDDR
ncbi:YitT family protein [uncultured Anaerococcus sp.]|uniref:YitT family protein n=1 Tax=uncultured Anaerococcus sp. TaxID=293428 RepID=UPI0025F0E613|nr:YitT family protein [uncultured Anaerococcus sp.]